MAPAVDRAFLERSIEDLDREFAAGDLTERDYRRLRADYERRLRGEAPPPRPPARPGLVVASVAFVLVVAVAAGVLVARSSGRRTDGGNITGGEPVTTTAGAEPSGPTTTLPDALEACRAAGGGEAIDCFTAYTQANPEDPRGWVQFALFAINAANQNGSTELLDAGETFLGRALEIDPADVEARVYLAVLLDRTERAEEAAAECARLADAEVPADLRQLVDLACE